MVNLTQKLIDKIVNASYDEDWDTYEKLTGYRPTDMSDAENHLESMKKRKSPLRKDEHIVGNKVKRKWISPAVILDLGNIIESYPSNNGMLYRVNYFGKNYNILVINDEAVFEEEYNN